jgi:asparagine synthase (glutamine-hydrolysing)
MYRYVAFVWNPHGDVGARGRDFLDRLNTEGAQWSIAHEGRGVLAMHVAREPGTATSYTLHGHAGVILGQLFDRRCDEYSSAREVRFDASQSKTLIDSGGQYLIDHYWGSYLAILYDEAANRHHVFRDPIGTLPCYRVQHAGAEIFFSHLEDCMRLAPFALQINRRHLTKWLFFSGVRTDETGLENVTHLGRGQRLTLSSTGAACTPIWDPVAIASQVNFQQPAESARALRATVQNTVNAWASRYRRITHKVSGGLDSAIVAGCLAQAASSPQVTYLNMVVGAGPGQQTFYLPGVDAKSAARVRAIAMHGDERYYARLVAQRWSVPLIERPRNASMDLARLERVPLGVAPSMYFTVMEMDDADLELIDSHSTQAFFSGQAGDSVLLATLRPLAAIDHAYLHGLSRDLWGQIAGSSALAKDSLWSVMGKAVKHGLLRRPYTGRMKVLDRPTLLTQELFQSLQDQDLQSTYARAAMRSSLPPGKQDHIKGIASAFHNFVFYAGDRADYIDPLSSQPVWETVLRLPTYTMLMGGVSRGLARHAFSELLPPEIRRRVSKGTGTLFYQQVVRRNRRFLIERLEAGLLVAHGYLDRRRLMACLTAEEPSAIISPSLILAYLAAESWLQRVKALPAAHAARANENTARLYSAPGPRRTAARNETSPDCVPYRSASAPAAT